MLKLNTKYGSNNMTTFFDALTLTRRRFTTVAASVPIQSKPVDPRMVAYLAARARRIATYGEAHIEAWDDEQYTNPTGYFYEGWITLF